MVYYPRASFLGKYTIDQPRFQTLQPSCLFEPNIDKCYLLFEQYLREKDLSKF